jgi:hypothetical protein
MEGKNQVIPIQRLLRREEPGWFPSNKQWIERGMGGPRPGEGELEVIYHLKLEGWVVGGMGLGNGHTPIYTCVNSLPPPPHSRGRSSHSF